MLIFCKIFSSYLGDEGALNIVNVCVYVYSFCSSTTGAAYFSKLTKSFRGENVVQIPLAVVVRKKIRIALVVFYTITLILLYVHSCFSFC